MKATDWIILWNSFIVINGGHGKLGDGIILSDSFMSPTEAGNQRPGTTGSCFICPRLIAENHNLAIILLEQLYSQKWRPQTG